MMRNINETLKKSLTPFMVSPLSEGTNEAVLINTSNAIRNSKLLDIIRNQLKSRVWIT